jgi:hypothetical protein
MSKIALSGNASGTGTFTIASPDSSTDRTLNLPDAAGTMMLTNTAVAKSQLPAGSVLQVLSDVNTNDFSTSSQNVFVTTSQSLSITPSSASNKILVMFNARSVTTLAANTAIDIEVRRSGTTICKGGYYTATVSGNQTVPFGVIQSLDSPATTSSVTYEVFAAEGGVPGTVGLNADRVLTLMEIAG